MDADATLPSFCHAYRRALHAVIDLQSIANVAGLPRSACKRRISIHSEMSKLDLPVLAAKPLSPKKFCFSGRLLPLKPDTVELVTQGGLPSISNCPCRLLK